MFTQEAMRVALIFAQTESHKIAIYQPRCQRDAMECEKSPVKVTSNQNRALNNGTVSKQKLKGARSIGRTWAFKRITALFSNFSCKTQIIHYQESAPRSFFHDYSCLKQTGP